MKYEMLLIRYPGDNDFSGLLYQFAKILMEAELRPVKPLSGPLELKDRIAFKKRVADHFNVIGNELHHIFSGRKVDFLKITPGDVYWGDEEVGEKLKTYHQWGNHDSVLIHSDGVINII